MLLEAITQTAVLQEGFEQPPRPARADLNRHKAKSGQTASVYAHLLCSSMLLDGSIQLLLSHILALSGQVSHLFLLAQAQSLLAQSQQHL